MYKYSGKIIRAGKAWTDNDGIQHSSGWMRWSPELKAQRGLVWHDDPKPVDGRFWFAEGVPRDLEELKANHIADANAQAGVALAATDWVIVKAMETGEAADADVLASRAELRAACNAYQAEIAACQDLDAAIAIWNKRWM